jgi:membrane protease YdiL (CAAX protease family)
MDSATGLNQAADMSGLPQDELMDDAARPQIETVAGRAIPGSAQPNSPASDSRARRDLDEWPPHRVLRTAVSLELALVIAALVLAAVGFSAPRSQLIPATAWQWLTEIGIGIAAVFPMMLVMGFVDRTNGPMAHAMRRTIDELLVPLFARFSVGQMAIVSILAGIGEEMAFRWCLQGGLAEWLAWAGAPWVALIIASVVFGVCHWINSAYFVMATLIGLYLGGMMYAFGSVVPSIVAHGVYDFLALYYIARLRPRP